MESAASKAAAMESAASAVEASAGKASSVKSAAATEPAAGESACHAGAPMHWSMHRVMATVPATSAVPAPAGIAAAPSIPAEGIEAPAERAEEWIHSDKGVIPGVRIPEPSRLESRAIILAGNLVIGFRLVFRPQAAPVVEIVLRRGCLEAHGLLLIERPAVIVQLRNGELVMIFEFARAAVAQF